MAEDAAAAAAPEKPKKKLSLPLVPLLIGLNLTGALGGLALTYFATLGAEKPVMTEKQANDEVYKSDIFGDKPIVYSLDPFTVNLSGEEKRIINIDVTLEMIDEDGFEEVVTMGAQARDTIVHILNGKSYSEIQSIQGKLYLKDEITLALNQQLQKSFIKDIYFSRFVISSQN